LPEFPFTVLKWLTYSTSLDTFFFKYNNIFHQKHLNPMSYIFIPFVKMEIANQTALRNGPAHMMNNTEDYDFRQNSI
jgi:hypothetical protein